MLTQSDCHELVQERHDDYVAQALAETEAKAEYRRKYIFLLCMLEDQAAAHTLQKQYDKLLIANSGRSQLVRDALWTGICALNDRMRSDTRELRDRGHLLFAFTGTTVLRGLL
jgi:hypothetical protein